MLSAEARDRTAQGIAGGRVRRVIGRGAKIPQRAAVDVVLRGLSADAADSAVEHDASRAGDRHRSRNPVVGHRMHHQTPGDVERRIAVDEQLADRSARVLDLELGAADAAGLAHLDRAGRGVEAGEHVEAAGQALRLGLVVVLADGDLRMGGHEDRVGLVGVVHGDLNGRRTAEDPDQVVMIVGILAGGRPRTDSRRGAIPPVARRHGLADPVEGVGQTQPANLGEVGRRPFGVVVRGDGQTDVERSAGADRQVAVGGVGRPVAVRVGQGNRILEPADALGVRGIGEIDEFGVVELKPPRLHGRIVDRRTVQTEPLRFQASARPSADARAAERRAILAEDQVADRPQHRGVGGAGVQRVAHHQAGHPPVVAAAGE